MIRSPWNALCCVFWGDAYRCGLPSLIGELNFDQRGDLLERDRQSESRQDDISDREQLKRDRSLDQQAAGSRQFATFRYLYAGLRLRQGSQAPLWCLLLPVEQLFRHGGDGREDRHCALLLHPLPGQDFEGRGAAWVIRFSLAIVQKRKNILQSLAIICVPCLLARASWLRSPGGTATSGCGKHPVQLRNKLLLSCYPLFLWWMAQTDWASFLTHRSTAVKPLVKSMSSVLTTTPWKRETFFQFFPFLLDFVFLSTTACSAFVCSACSWASQPITLAQAEGDEQETDRALWFFVT